DQRHHLQVEINTPGWAIPADERARMQLLLESLGEAAADFHAANLRLTATHHPASALYNVHFKLALPGRTLATSEEDAYLDTAFQRGLRKLTRKLEAFKEHPDEAASQLAQRHLAL